MLRIFFPVFLSEYFRYDICNIEVDMINVPFYPQPKSEYNGNNSHYKTDNVYYHDFNSLLK